MEIGLLPSALMYPQTLWYMMRISPRFSTFAGTLSFASQLSPGFSAMFACRLLNTCAQINS